MLNTIKRNITLMGPSQISGKGAAGYTATINSDEPEEMSFSWYQIDKSLYKANREQCRKDQAEFEDYAYTVQDQMIREQNEAAKEEVKEGSNG